MSLTDQLANAIAQFEGYWKPNSRAQRNNNPGNLRAGPRAIGKDSGGYAMYRTEADGWADLYRQIDLDAGRGLSLQSFIAKYGPPSENNTSSYLSFVAGQLGVSPDTRLADLGRGDPVNFPKAPSPGRPRPTGGPSSKAKPRTNRAG